MLTILWPMVDVPYVQLLWSYAKKSVALRVRYFQTLPKGVESHTVLVQDIPGMYFGTQVQRAASVAPKFIADRVYLMTLNHHKKIVVWHYGSR